jgi:hypothetical protein
MRRVLSLGALLALLTVSLTSCFVREKSVQCVPSTTNTASASGCVWVGEYKDAGGRVHAAHWRCPGTIDAY